MKNFRLKLITRVCVLAALFAGGFFAFFKFDSYLVLIIMFILATASVINIITVIGQTNRVLSRFLASIKYSDFSQSFGSKKAGNGFDELNNAINNVMDQFRQTRAEKEEQYRFLQTVLRHIPIGLLSFDQSGKIEFLNKSARKIMGFTINSGILSLNNLPEDFRSKLQLIKPGERLPVKIFIDNEIIQLICSSTEFRMHGQQYTLVSIQNIQTELEEKELEAWQKLIRVLTHEIMNSVTPISSLAATVNDVLKNSKSSADFNNEQLDDIKTAIRTIEKRSAGLIGFVNNYRNLTKIPKPDFEIVPVDQLFERTHKLLHNQITLNDIQFTIEVIPQSLEITADPALIEQVLINLIQNSIQAVSAQKHKSIRLTAELNRQGKIILKVSDNGPGIPEDIHENIFIPFFSTKKEGSGIGLSLARQIMRAHGGNIRLKSETNKNTEFSLIF